MKQSIEFIWKEGFSESELLKAPRVDNLYSQKSKHLTDKFIGMFKTNLIAILGMAFAFWFVYLILDAILIGTFIMIIFLALAYYSNQQMKQIKNIDSGLNSYEYLVSFDQFIKDSISKHTRVMRFFYPLMFLTAMSTIWFAGSNGVFLTNKLIEKFPDLIFVGGIPLVGLIIVCVITLLIAYFSDKIYRWDVEMIYGRMFEKLQKTISEFEYLRDKV
ncbi:MAG: hypothetical protein JXR03_04515 [Cyclobacteriaceae bacterium]